MLTWDYVTVERQDAVALVRYDRGGRGNALDQKALIELRQVAEVLGALDDLRAIVLTGNTEYFSAGFDMTDESWHLSADAPLEARRRIARRGSEMCAAWARIPHITIAAIEGYAVGGGVALALAADWRIMGQSGFLSVPEVAVGLNLGWGALPRMVSLVGPARAKRAIVLCDRLDAATAMAWGLVDEATADGAAVERSLALAERVAQQPESAVRMTKQSVDALATALHPLAAHMDADQGLLAFEGPDFAAQAAKFTKRHRD